MFNLYKKTFKYSITTQNSILPIDIFFRVLSKKEIENLTELYYENEKNLYVVKIVETALLKDYKKYIDEISDDDLQKIYNIVMENSIVSPEIFDKFRKLFWLQQSKDLQSDTWNCEICKERRLQYSRNCPYLNYPNKDFKMVIDGEVFTACPIYDLNENSELLFNAYRAYSMYDKGLLPEVGGFYDQTNFFVEFSLLVKTLVKEKEAKDIEQAKKD